MKRIFLLNLFFLVLFTSSCDVLQQAADYGRFTQCEFSLGAVKITEIGGVQISVLKNPEQIGMLNIMSLTQQLLGGSLPIKLAIIINAKNNHGEKAAISGCDWILVKQANQLLAGTLDQYVEVLPYAESSFPINTEIDILKLFNANSINPLLDFVFNDDKIKELYDMGVAIKIRPYYNLGSSVYKSPEYFTIPL